MSCNIFKLKILIYSFIWAFWLIEKEADLSNLMKNYFGEWTASCIDDCLISTAHRIFCWKNQFVCVSGVDNQQIQLSREEIAFVNI